MFETDKINFVNDIYPNSEKSRKWVLSTLSLLSKYEEAWGVDFAVQEYEPLQKAFDTVIATTYNGAKTVMVRFKKYAQWRMEHSLPCSDAIFRLKINQIAKIRDSMVASPQGLKEVLDYVFDAPSEETSDIVYRVFLWLGFFGVSAHDSISITADEVDINELKIVHAGVAYPIYPASLPDIEKACSAVIFKDRGRCFNRTDGNEILRGKANSRSPSLEETIKKTIRPTIARRFSAATEANNNSDDPVSLGLSLTHSRICTSGMFYRMFLSELNGAPPDFEEYAIAEFARGRGDGQPYEVSAKNPKAAILRRIRVAAEADYTNWKRAFYS